MQAETHCTRLTVGGNLIDYPGNVSTPAADLITLKVLLNSTISKPGACFMTGEVKNFYLNTLLKRYEYMRQALSLIPEQITPQNKLQGIFKDVHV